MKKIKLFSIAAIAALMTLGACGGTIFPSSNLPSDSSKVNDSRESFDSRGEQSSLENSSQNPGPSSSSIGNSSSSYDEPDDEEYTIAVNSPSGVTATLSKTKAKQGEKITLSLSITNGYNVTNVTATNTTLTKVSDTKYEFVMPGRSVRITIYVDVSGDVVLTGEIAATFTKEANGVYAARNIKVESNKARVGFDVVTKSANGEQRKISVTEFDESISFADVTSTYKSNYSLEIASGSTYDFFYDASREFPFYVIRTRVDKIPTTADGVYSLFSGKMRSSPACHPTNLVGIDYNYEDPTLKYNYNYKLYGNNESLATINDTSDPENPETYYVYKKADLAKNLYTVVNTWTKAKGNNENGDYVWDLDPNKDDKTVYWQPYSAQLEITPTDTDNKRHEISVREALRDVNAGAHYGAELEYEFYDTYRSVYEGNVIINAPKNCNLDLQSKANADGSFDVEINAWTEYDYEATANTADATAHEGNVYTNKLHFLSNGALETVDCKKIHYEQREWNFSTHKPVGAGVTTHFTVRNTFGNVNAGSPSFDTTPYFINKINSLSWYNSLTGQAASTTESNVNYNDILEIIPYGNRGKKASLCYSFAFEPSTALDGWQYSVVNSSDTTKIAKTSKGFQAVGVGSANVTVNNGNSASNGPSFTTKVTSHAAGTVHSFFINCNIQGYDSFGCNNATILEAYAGKRTTYYVDTGVNTGAPCEYQLFFRSKNQFGDYVYSETNEYITVVQTGTTLILDCNNEKALALTERYTVTVKVMSDYYLTGWGPSQWEIHVNPKDKSAIDVIGTSWIFNSYVDRNNNPIKDYTTVTFSNNFVGDETDGIRSGVITDYMYDGDTLRYTAKWSFIYQIAASGKINAKITKFESTNPEDSDMSYLYFGVEFGGFQGNLLLVALWYDSPVDYASVLGTIGFDDEENVYVESYFGFTQQK